MKDDDKFDDYFDRLQKRQLEHLKMGIIMFSILGVGYGLYWLYNNFDKLNLEMFN